FAGHARPSRLYTLSLHDALPILNAQELSTKTLEELHEILKADNQNNHGNRPILSNRGVIASEKAELEDEHPNNTSTGTNGNVARSEEHTSELQSRENLVCRLLLE